MRVGCDMGYGIYLMFPMIDSDDEVIEDCYNVDKHD